MGNHAGILISEGKTAQAESVYKEMAQRFPAARAAQAFPAIFLYMRGQYDSTESVLADEDERSEPPRQAERGERAIEHRTAARRI